MTPERRRTFLPVREILGRLRSRHEQSIERLRRQARRDGVPERERLFFDVLADAEDKSIEAVHAAAAGASPDVLDVQIQYAPKESQDPADARAATGEAVEARGDLVVANRVLHDDMQQLADRRGSEDVGELFRSLAKHYDRTAKELSLVDPDRTMGR